MFRTLRWKIQFDAGLRDGLTQGFCGCAAHAADFSVVARTFGGGVMTSAAEILKSNADPAAYIAGQRG